MAYKSSYDLYRRRIQKYISAQKQKGIDTYELKEILSVLGTEKQMRKAGFTGQKLATLTKQLKSIDKAKNYFSSTISLGGDTFYGTTKDLQAHKRKYFNDINAVAYARVEEIFSQLNRQPETTRLRNGNSVKKWSPSVEHALKMAEDAKNLLNNEINSLAARKYNGKIDKAKAHIGQWFLNNISMEELIHTVYDQMINYESVDAQISAANKFDLWVKQAADDVSQNFMDIQAAFEMLNEAESYDDSFDDLPF